MLNILFGLEIGSNDKIQAPRSGIDLTKIQSLHYGRCSRFFGIDNGDAKLDGKITYVSIIHQIHTKATSYRDSL